MSVLICTRGLPGSGKSTYALKRLSEAEPGALVRVNRDDLRRGLHGQPHHLPVTEQQVTTVQHATVERMLRSGVDVIVDDTLLRAAHLRNLAEIAWKVTADVDVQDFTDVPLETCILRDSARPDPVGEDVIRRMHARYLQGRRMPLPLPVRPERVTGALYVPDLTRAKAVMVDVDGTVALHGARDPYDFARCGEDLPNAPVISAVVAMHREGYRLVFCSGRPDTYRELTTGWLVEHVPGAPGSALFMRRAGDGRPDDLVKRDLFDEHIRDRWNVVAVFDDRARVVDMWRSLGLTVFQVAPGHF